MNYRTHPPAAVSTGTSENERRHARVCLDTFYIGRPQRRRQSLVDCRKRRGLVLLRTSPDRPGQTTEHSRAFRPRGFPTELVKQQDGAAMGKGPHAWWQ